MCFAEGTTTNGDYLLPFKTGAFLAKTPVMPVILKYPYERFSPAWDTITGASDICFNMCHEPRTSPSGRINNSQNLLVLVQVRHVCLLLCQFINYLEVIRLPVYCPTAKECSDPKFYAENVRRLMAAEVIPATCHVANLTMSLTERQLCSVSYESLLWSTVLKLIVLLQGGLTLSDIGLPEKRVYHSALRGNSLPKTWGAKHRKSD